VRFLYVYAGPVRSHAQDFSDGKEMLIRLSKWWRVAWEPEREVTSLEMEHGEAGPNEEELMVIARDLCRSKAKEFVMLGYEHVTPDDIWNCISARYKNTGMPRLHSMVNDILSLKATQFMNWMTMQAFKGASF